MEKIELAKKTDIKIPNGIYVGVCSTYGGGTIYIPVVLSLLDLADNIPKIFFRLSTPLNNPGGITINIAYCAVPSTTMANSATIIKNAGGENITTLLANTIYVLTPDLISGTITTYVRPTTPNDYISI